MRTTDDRLREKLHTRGGEGIRADIDARSRAGNFHWWGGEITITEGEMERRGHIAVMLSSRSADRSAV